MATVYPLSGLDLHTALKVRSKVSLPAFSEAKSPGGHLDNLALTTRYIQAICIALPHLHADTHTDTRVRKRGGMFA